MFHYIDNYGFNVSMTSPSIQFQILNHGIYDKSMGKCRDSDFGLINEYVQLVSGYYWCFYIRRLLP